MIFERIGHWFNGLLLKEREAESGNSSKSSNRKVALSPRPNPFIGRRGFDGGWDDYCGLSGGRSSSSGNIDVVISDWKTKYTFNKSITDYESICVSFACDDDDDDDDDVNDKKIRNNNVNIRDLYSMIRKDVLRTDRLTFLKGDEEIQKLERILLTYSSNREISYCQGMNEIASTILFNTSSSEWVAYYVFEYMMDQKGYQKYFHIDSENQGIEDIVILLRKADPQLYDRLCFCEENSKMIFLYPWILLFLKRQISNDLHLHGILIDRLLGAPNGYEIYVFVSMILRRRDDFNILGHRFDFLIEYITEECKKEWDIGEICRLLDVADRLYEEFG